MRGVGIESHRNPWKLMETHGIFLKDPVCSNIYRNALVYLPTSRSCPPAVRVSDHSTDSLLPLYHSTTSSSVELVVASALRGILVASATWDLCLSYIASEKHYVKGQPTKICTYIASIVARGLRIEDIISKYHWLVLTPDITRGLPSVEV